MGMQFSKESWVGNGQLIAASLLIGVTFNHRLYSGWDSLPDAQSDLADLIAYVRNNSDSLRFDRDRVALWVFSGRPSMKIDPNQRIRFMKRRNRGFL
jgi:hypothetical protein